VKKEMKRRDFIIKGGGIFTGLWMTPIVAPLQDNPNKSIKLLDMNNRMRTFDVPHKGIRNGLSQLSLAAGNTDYQVSSEVEKLVTLGREVFLLMNTHAQDENDVSLRYLEEKMKGSSNHDVEDHIRLHVAQSRLEKLLANIFEHSQKGEAVTAEGSEFYSLLADYHAEYLQHMAEEERVTQQLLWDNFTDEELTMHRTEIMKKLPADTLLLWFKYIAPAQSHPERLGLFKGFKANAPESLYRDAMVLLKNVLDDSDYQRLMRELN
jgi:hypothetical protein